MIKDPKMIISMTQNLMNKIYPGKKNKMIKRMKSLLNK